MEPLSRITPATADVLAALLEAGEPDLGTPGRARHRPPDRQCLSDPGTSRARGVGRPRCWEADPERSGPRRRLYELTADGALAAREAVAHVQAPRRTSAVRITGSLA